MKKNISNLMIILIISLVLSLPLISDNINVFRDDGIQHIIRISEQTNSIKNYTSSNVMINLCNGFGYSWNLFYGQFTSIVPAMINLIIHSSIISFKIFLFLCLFASGITMYITSLKITKNKEISLISALFYIMVPYHLTDMYIRYAVSEFASFIFIPLVFLGLNSILNDEKDDILFLCIGSIGLIITHLISTLVTAIFAIIFLIINYKKIKNVKIVKKLIIAIVFIVTISSFFWAPLLESMLATKYAVFEDGIMSTIDSVNYNRISLLELLRTPNGNINFKLGINIIILTILSIFAIKNVNEKYKKTYKIFLLFGIISIIFTTKLINWNYMPKILLNLQFPWRMLEFATFFLSLICAINLTVLIKDLKQFDIVFITGVVLFCSIVSVNIEMNETRLTDPLPGKIENLRINAGCAKYEYLPLKAYNNKQYIKERTDGIYVLNGDIDIISEEKDYINYYAKIDNKTENSKLELPYIYYLGYQVKINNNKINYSESKNGFMQIEIDEIGTSEITVEYSGTIIMNLTKVVSLIGIVIFCVYIFRIRKNN